MLFTQKKGEKYVSKDRDSIGIEGVSVGTVRRWEKEKKERPGCRTIRRQRRYSLARILGKKEKKRKRDFVFFSLYDIGFDILIAFPVIKNDTASAKYVL